MIKIEAVVRPERVNPVVEALTEAGCGGYHVANVTGKGTQQGVEVFTGRGATMTTRAAVPKSIVTTVVVESLKEAEAIPAAVAPTVSAPDSVVPAAIAPAACSSVPEEHAG